MQKKLLALAIAGALSAPLVAQAQGSNVQIYGVLQPSIDLVDNGDESGIAIEDNNSRLGFKGSEDLGGGLKAIFQLESRVAFDERGGGGGWTNRDSWVGLAGSFGSLTIGNHQSAYVRSTASLDPFADTIGDYNNIMAVTPGGDQFNTRFTNSIYYTSPKFGGFQVLASYTLNAEEGPGEDETDDDSFSLAGTYSAGAFSVTAAYEKQKDAGFDPNDNATAMKLGASFKILPTTTLYAMAERVDLDGDFDNRDAYYIGAKHSMGNIDLQANILVARDSDDGDDGAKGFALGAVYNFSKRTNIGAYYANLKNDSDVGDGAFYGLDSAGGPAAGEDKVSAFSVRMRHTF